jgi:hypothetical protein
LGGDDWKTDSEIYEINSCQNQKKNNGLAVHCFVDPIGNAAEIIIVTKCGRWRGEPLINIKRRWTNLQLDGAKNKDKAAQ